VASLAAAALALAGCATGGGPGPSPGPADDPPAPEEPADVGDGAGTAPAVLDEVARLREAGRFRDAALLADSLYFRTLERGDAPATAADALRRQARALEEAGDLVAAADRLRELLDRYPDRAGGDASVRLARILIERAEDPGAAEVLLRRPGPDRTSEPNIHERCQHGGRARGSCESDIQLDRSIVRGLG
jgi:tetratricopeptide (TPR) repeat protein